MSSKLILLFLPLVYCRININILASTISNEATVEAIGADSEILSDIERGTFKITDRYLRDAVTKFSGGRPTNVYVKSPTPWHDLYKTYEWDEVRRILQPDAARVTAVTSENVIISRHEFVNNSSSTATFRTGIAQKVDETISNRWTKNGNLTVNQDTSYSVSFSPVGGATRIIYQNRWGEEKTERRAVLIGKSAAVDVVLQPGQTATATLTANRGSLDVEIDYVATLEGEVACNYPREYNGHHFWAYDVNKVLTEARLPQEVASKEVIRVKFYADARINVLDKRSNVRLIDIPVDIILSKR